MKVILDTWLCNQSTRNIHTLSFVIYPFVAEELCQTNPCSDICGVVNGTEHCFCPVGYELSIQGGTECIGIT